MPVIWLGYYYGCPRVRLDWVWAQFGLDLTELGGKKRHLLLTELEIKLDQVGYWVQLVRFRLEPKWQILVENCANMGGATHGEGRSSHGEGRSVHAKGRSSHDKGRFELSEGR